MRRSTSDEQRRDHRGTRGEWTLLARHQAHQVKEGDVHGTGDGGHPVDRSWPEIRLIATAPPRCDAILAALDASIVEANTSLLDHVGEVDPGELRYPPQTEKTPSRRARFSSAPCNASLEVLIEGYLDRCQ